MEILIGLVILYIIQAVLVYGMTFGYFEGRWPGTRNHHVATKIAIVGGLLPLLGVILVFGLSERIRYGIRFK